MVEFKYELDKLMEGLPEEVTGTLKGSIIAKADKMDQDAAIAFIDSKVEDGTLNKELGDRLCRLVNHYCFYR
ncbi:MAG: hypothetical protein AYK23_02900 [Candidatus Proteinoplasmatales archaeon SG8-5]|nr:MAG: hypothetical protein AYK23_02900 [Candidatus Proteinoplasmatales archaeon SG8-5]